MSIKNQNTEHIEGYLFDIDLQNRKVQRADSANFGQDFIMGEISIATDEDMLNVVPIHFTYVTPQTKKGQPNATYNILNKFIQTKPTVVAAGKEGAAKVSINTNLAINDFYAQDGTQVAQMRNEGGFLNEVSMLKTDLAKRNEFRGDAILTGCRRVEADEERHIENDYLVISGYMFNFRNDILPVTFRVTNEQGMDFFESLELSEKNPSYRNVWGQIINETVITTKTEESVFGAPIVTEVRNTNRAWIITGTKPMDYDFDEEVQNLVTQKMAERNIMLADVKRRSDEYRASKGAASAANTSFPTVPQATANPIPSGSFNGFGGATGF